MNYPEHIITHSGIFHADEVFAIAALRVLVPDCPVTRTRDNDVLNEGLNDPGTWVIDVGYEFDSARGNFDHHQPEFTRTHPDNEHISMSSFGLIWEHVGTWVVEALCPDPSITHLSPSVWQFVQEMLVWQIDATDNGQLRCQGWLKGVHPKETLPFTTISSVIFSANHYGDTEDRNFAKALSIADVSVRATISKGWARILGELHVDECDDGSPVLVLSQPNVSWGGSVKEHHQFVVYPRGDNDWGLSTVHKVDDKFTPKVPLPESWGGLRDRDLEKETGIPDMVFCHKALFMAVAQTQEAAVEAAFKALEFNTPK